MGLCQSKKHEYEYSFHQGSERLNTKQSQLPNTFNKTKPFQNIKNFNTARPEITEQPLTPFNKKSKSARKLAVNSELIVNCYESNPFNSYTILSKIGEGAYGTAWKVKHKKTKLIRAMKKITKSAKANSQNVSDIINEIEMLKKGDHPNIVKIFEFFVDNEGYYLITEFCSGGELFDTMRKIGKFSEPVAANIMYQIFSAVNYCHSTTNIIHRDGKPENILIVNKDDNTGFFNIKIIDFGTAKIYEKNKNENKVIGSSLYIAPEVLAKNYNEKCDIWSCGVIGYIGLAGRVPFSGQKDGEIGIKIRAGKYDIKRKPFDVISLEAKDLIRNCLEMDAGKRGKAIEALRHKWFTKLNTKDFFCQVTEFTLKKVLINIRNYRPKNKLQELALTYGVHNLPEGEEIKVINKIFHGFNTNSNGKLTRNEVKEGLKKYFFKQSTNEYQLEKQTDDIFYRIDNDNNGFIENEEFVRAGIDKNILKEPSLLKFTFEYIDKDHSGEISIDELKQVFRITSKEDEKVLRQLLYSIDEDMNGEISFQEYKNMMKKIIE